MLRALDDPRLMLNLRHLRAFVAVADTGTVSSAADAVHLTQPAVTQAMTRLESVLGAGLLDRQASRVFLTATGAGFARRARAALEQVAQGAAGLGPRAERGLERRVSVTQLRALLALGEAGSFSAAAQRLSLSQPALHRAARDLEKSAGVALFTRTARGVALTEGAEILARHVRLAFAELRQGLSEMDARRGQDRSRIAIGTLPLARSRVLPRAICRMAADRPGVVLSVVDGPYDGLMRGLRHGEIDMMVGALRGEAAPADVLETPLFESVLTVVARAGHPLAGRRLGLRDIAGARWIVPRPGTPTRQLFEDWFATGGLDLPEGMLETSSLILVRGCLLEGDWLAIISAQQVREEVEAGHLVRLDIQPPDTPRAIGLTHRRDWTPTPSEAAFIGHLKAAARG